MPASDIVATRWTMTLLVDTRARASRILKRCWRHRGRRTIAEICEVCLEKLFGQGLERITDKQTPKKEMDSKDSIEANNYSQPVTTEAPWCKVRHSSASQPDSKNLRDRGPVSIPVTCRVQPTYSLPRPQPPVIRLINY